MILKMAVATVTLISRVVFKSLDLHKLPLNLKSNGIARKTAATVAMNVTKFVVKIWFEATLQCPNFAVVTVR